MNEGGAERPVLIVHMKYWALWEEIRLRWIENIWFADGSRIRHIPDVGQILGTVERVLTMQPADAT